MQTQLAQANDIVGNYRLIKLIGEGGQSQVWEVEDDKGQIYAMKIVHIPPSIPDHKVALDSVHREIAILEALSKNGCNEFTVCYHEHRISADGNTFYIIMEYLDGRDLEYYIPFIQPKAIVLTLEQKAAILYQISDCVDYIHDRGIVHRDLKPSNIIETQGLLKLIDFGFACAYSSIIVRVNCDMQALGSYEYIAPEVLTRTMRSISDWKKADVYAMGVTMYELANNRPPYVGTNGYEWLDAKLAPIPKSDSGYPDIDDLIMQMLRPEPLLRPTAKIVKTLLTKYV